MNRTRTIGALTVALCFGMLALAGCTKGGGENTVQVKGSDTLLHLSTEWAEAFMKGSADIEVTVTGGGSGTGISALLNGTCDVANASRKIKEEEKENAEKKGLEIKEFTVARDGISVIVHPGNPVDTITMEQLKKIFTGQYDNWKSVGGPDLAIVVLSRDHSSGTHAYFKKRVLEKKEYVQSARFLASNSAIVASVKEDAGAIGYVGLGYYEDAKGDVKALAVKDGEADPVGPSLETVTSGAYPISRTLQVYTAGEPEGVVKTYIDFILGEAGQKIVAAKGFVPVE